MDTQIPVYPSVYCEQSLLIIRGGSKEGQGGQGPPVRGLAPHWPPQMKFLVNAFGDNSWSREFVIKFGVGYGSILFAFMLFALYVDGVAKLYHLHVRLDLFTVLYADYMRLVDPTI